MYLRSLLFVPGDRPDRFEKAVRSGADALVLDLEDSVAESSKAKAREAVGQFLHVKPAVPVFVRTNSIASGSIEDDIAVACSGYASGIVLPKASGADSIRHVVGLMPSTGVPIIPIVTETPASIFVLDTYREVRSRLSGMVWGAEDLTASMGATSTHEDDGTLIAPLEMVRSLALMAARAAGVAAYDGVFTNLADADGLARHAERGRRHGFTGMFAIHPGQIATINRAFSPDEADVSRARAIVEAFAASPESGALKVDGRMVDRPHLRVAQRILAQSTGNETETR